MMMMRQCIQKLPLCYVLSYVHNVHQVVCSAQLSYTSSLQASLLLAELCTHDAATARFLGRESPIHIQSCCWWRQSKAATEDEVQNQCLSCHRKVDGVRLSSPKERKGWSGSTIPKLLFMGQKFCRDTGIVVTQGLSHKCSNLDTGLKSMAARLRGPILTLH